MSTLANNLISYYKFDENSGTIVNDSFSINNGTWLGTLGAQWAPGIINSAGSFNGGDNSVDLGTPAAFSISVFTLAGWIFPTNSSGGGIISSRTNNGYEFRYNNTRLELLKSNLVSIGTSLGTFGLSAWTHGVVTYDPSGIYNFYINGTSSGIGTNAQTFNQGGAQIGRQPVAEFFTGKLDEVGIWSRVLTAAEITALYNGGFGIQYPFDGGIRRRRGIGN